MKGTFARCTALASPITINIASGKTIVSTDSDPGTNQVNIYQTFIGCNTSNIDLKVTNEYLGADWLSEKDLINSIELTFAGSSLC